MVCKLISDILLFLNIIECVVICFVVVRFFFWVLVNYFLFIGLFEWSCVFVVMNVVEWVFSVFCKCLLKSDSDKMVVIDSIMVSNMMVSLLCLVLCLKSC